MRGVGAGGTVITDIWDCVERLLEKRYEVPDLPLSSGKCVCLSALVPLTLMPDKGSQATFGMTRMEAIEVRY